MKAAVVEDRERPPRYMEFEEPQAGDGELLVNVHVAALSNLVKAQVTGKHYSSGGSHTRFVAGYDGVGTLPDGRRTYFFGPRPPFGSMAELSAAPARHTILLPDEVDDVTAAALGNPGLASWGALLGRAGFQPGECVLINGATGVAGKQAIQVAKYLGASRIIATGRDEAALATLRELGADETVSLRQDDLVQAFRQVMNGVDVVLDYLWGASAQAILEAHKGTGGLHRERRVRYVQIGSIGGDPIPVRSEWLRSSGIELLGSGLGSLSSEAIVRALSRMFGAIASGTDFRIEAVAIPLKDVESVWYTESRGRIVFTI